MENVLDVLRERGFVQDINDEDGLRRALEQPITLYYGIDATADSLTIGHMVGVMMLAWFQRTGHRPIALMGGGTSLIGDPTGREASRPILTPEEIEHNVRGIRGQLEYFLNFSDDASLVLNNAEWLTTLNYVDFMRDIGSRFSVNEILRLEAYRTRLEAGGLSFLEFSYVLMQSYDFLQLYQRYNCVLQIGGSDQWGNSIAGADLIRRVTGGQAYVLVCPLLLTAAGDKMGKTVAGAVWLKTPPYEYYQYWRNTEDRDVARFLATFTFLPMDEVRRLTEVSGAELNTAKEVLALEATRILYGEDTARRAQEQARAAFGAGSVEDMPTDAIDCARLTEGITVVELFKQFKLVTSANEARSLITQGGLSINGTPVRDPRALITRDALADGHLLLSRGRKRHLRIVCTE